MGDEQRHHQALRKDRFQVRQHEGDRRPKEQTDPVESKSGSYQDASTTSASRNYSECKNSECDRKEDTHRSEWPSEIFSVHIHTSHPTTKLTGRGEQHPTSNQKGNMKNEVPALRSNGLLDCGSREPVNMIFCLT